MINSSTCSEKKINQGLVKCLTANSKVVGAELRFPPAELDVVALDLETCLLTNYEIKRGDWKKVLQQSVRGQLYCHYAVAVLPKDYIKNVPLLEFSSRGIGIMSYSIDGSIFCFESVLAAEQSKTINKYLKQEVYKELHRTGDTFNVTKS